VTLYLFQARNGQRQ